MERVTFNSGLHVSVSGSVVGERKYQFEMHQIKRKKLHIKFRIPALFLLFNENKQMSRNNGRTTMSVSQWSISQWMMRAGSGCRRSFFFALFRKHFNYFKVSLEWQKVLSIWKINAQVIITWSLQQLQGCHSTARGKKGDDLTKKLIAVQETIWRLQADLSWFPGSCLRILIG